MTFVNFVCVCVRARVCACMNISATVHCCFCIGVRAVFWGLRLFSVVLLVLNTAFIRSTNPCLCQTDPQPEPSRVAAENGWGVEATRKGNGYSLVHKTH
jgi:hypothetical protein